MAEGRSFLTDQYNSSPRLISPILNYLKTLHQDLLQNTSGTVATYIPELSHADPQSFGISIATIDGQVYTTGDVATEFTIQSMSKPFTYGEALRHLGSERVLQSVGVEPTGEAFNSIILDDVKNRPFNPMVNAGAISVANLLTGPDDEAEMLSLFSRLAGRELAIDEAVFTSEQETGHRNRAIAYMMLNSGMIDKTPDDVLRLYFKQCAVNVNCRDMAIMAASLANGGRNPLTHDQIYSADTVKDVLTLMSTCGMYDYAGQWAHEVGFPAKSGVAGGVIAIIPGQARIAIWSPPLDDYGNSVRGIEVCKQLSREFGLHVYGEKALGTTVIRRSATAKEIRSKRIRSKDQTVWLQEHGDQVGITKLQGMLYFGSTERVIRHLSAMADQSKLLILDFARVSNVDDAAIRLLTAALKEFQTPDRQILLSGIGQNDSVGHLRAVIASECPHVGFREDLDGALETAENHLLAPYTEVRDQAKYALSQIDLLEGLTAEDYKILEGMLGVLHYSANETIVREGDPANSFFVIVSGAASVSIAMPDGRRKRLASIGPGACFGEMALVQGGSRAADVIADEATMCYVFSVEKIFALAKDYPEIPITILSNMVRSVSGHLKTATQEIRNLD